MLLPIAMTPAIEEMLTIAPPPLRRMRGRAALTLAITPRTLTSRMRLTSALVERIEIAMRDEARYPGRVHKKVEPRVTPVDRRDRILERRAVRHRHAQRDVPVARQRAKHRFRLLAGGIVADGHRGAGLRERLADRGADASRAAGYDSHAARQRLRGHAEALPAILRVASGDARLGP
jgi:hypothetical protein